MNFGSYDFKIITIVLRFGLKLTSSSTCGSSDKSFLDTSIFASVHTSAPEIKLCLGNLKYTLYSIDDSYNQPSNLKFVCHK